MPSRSFRTALVLLGLLCLMILSSILPLAWHARAASSSTQQGHNFQPSGYGVTSAKRVSTFTVPQIHAKNTGQALIYPHATMSTPVVARALTTQNATPPEVVQVPPPSSTDPSAITGLSEDNQATADTNGAGGTENYLETDMVSLGIYDRSGNLEYTTTFQQWFGIKVPYNDPLVIWDDQGNRFIFSVNVGYELLLSVAQQSNALGSFCNYAFPTPNNYGSDFEKLGVNWMGIYLGANLVEPGTGNLLSNEMFMANRTQMENCKQKVSYISWTGLTNPDGSLAEAITPANEQSSGNGFEYFVNSLQFGGCQLILWTLNIYSHQLSNTSIPTQCYSPPTFAKQAGSTLRLGTGQDNSLTQASYLNGLVIVSLPGGYDWGDGNGIVTIIEWFVLNTSSASLLTQGAFGTPGFWLFFPAAVLTRTGHLLFVFNASGSTIDPSLWYVNQTFTNTTLLAQGNGPYQYGKGSPWGYYSSAWLDTTGQSPGSVWITGEYAQATNSWGSAFGLVTP